MAVFRVSHGTVGVAVEVAAGGQVAQALFIFLPSLAIRPCSVLTVTYSVHVHVVRTVVHVGLHVTPKYEWRSDSEVVIYVSRLVAESSAYIRSINRTCSTM
jgi:hypothetical protein